MIEQTASISSGNIFKIMLNTRGLKGTFLCMFYWEAQFGKKKNVEIDSTSGSRAYNRLDMQASQSLHMVLELYDKFNFEIIEDYYDDITILNLDKDPLVVSYYQMKTSDHVITIDSAIKKDWLVKMQRQMERPEGWIVKELGLITNTPLKVIFKVQGKNGKSITHKVEYKDPHTPFSKFDKSVRNRIINDIAAKCGIPTEEVDLSKFVHVHTTLSIERHRDIVEKKCLISFLQESSHNYRYGQGHLPDCYGNFNEETSI